MPLSNAERCRRYKAKHPKRIYAQRRKYWRANPWVRVHRNIKNRCEKPNCQSYIRYGGAGIECRITPAELKVLWYRDKAFDMHHPSIDRIDPDGHYTPANCRFIELTDNVSGARRAKTKEPTTWED